MNTLTTVTKINVLKTAPVRIVPVKLISTVLQMPLTKKGKKVKKAMKKTYGSKKGERVFYASKNKGTLKGVEKKKGSK